jgi:hypothetical protein
VKKHDRLMARQPFPPALALALPAVFPAASICILQDQSSSGSSITLANKLHLCMHVLMADHKNCLELAQPRIQHNNMKAFHDIQKRADMLHSGQIYLHQSL